MRKPREEYTTWRPIIRTLDGEDSVESLLEAVLLLHLQMDDVGRLLVHAQQPRLVDVPAHGLDWIGLDWPQPQCKP